MSKKDALAGSGLLTVLADGLFNSFDLVIGSVDLLMGNVDLLYPIILVLNRLSPSLEWLDQDLVMNLMVVIGVLYLVHLLLKLTERVKDEL